MSKKAICLFSSAGIGELGIKKNDIEIIISNEIIEERHRLYKQNYPNTECFTGDIWNKKQDIIKYYKDNFGNDDLFLLYATPPCQGMSSNGVGKLLSEIRKGNRKPNDERNRLIIPTMDIIEAIKPVWIVMENVPNMINTIINNENDEFINIIEYIKMRLGNEYVGKAEVVTCADYGIPQTRKRLITIFTRDKNGIEYFNKNGTFFPEDEKLDKCNWITLRDAIGGLPPLDAKEGYEKRTDFHPYHFVPIMNSTKYWWVSNTKEGDTAYNNQCTNPLCDYTDNSLHKDVINNGICQSNKDTPIYCERCGALLPRPTMIDKKTGELRLISGFHSAYRRMEWDKPATAITQNFQFEASDNKIHPQQNRVLSIYEAMIIQTINEYDFSFTQGNKNISRSLFAKILGECVPPRLIDIICQRIIRITDSSF